MTDDEIKLIHSPLSRTHSADGHVLHIQIYCGAGNPWVLEIEDELGTSTVWDDTFDTDQAALEAALAAIESEGVHSFGTHAQQAAKDAEPELMRQLAELEKPFSRGPHDMTEPLTSEEIDELDSYLLDLETEEGMTLDMLDGYLHALAIGPVTVMPSQWLPKVWGQDEGAMLPRARSLGEANHWLGLVMRHFNSIVYGFEQSPPVVEPFWSTVRYGDGEEFEDAEMWAYGFTEGVKLSRAAWQALLDDPDGRRWYRAIGLLGEEEFSADQDDLTRTPKQRAALAAEFEAGLTRIHAFWLPLRQAAGQREQAQRTSNKVGRNEPCPCGSGKKFKKCCGAPSELH